MELIKKKWVFIFILLVILMILSNIYVKKISYVKIASKFLKENEKIIEKLGKNIEIEKLDISIPFRIEEIFKYRFAKFEIKGEKGEASGEIMLKKEKGQWKIINVIMEKDGKNYFIEKYQKN